MLSRGLEVEVEEQEEGGRGAGMVQSRGPLKKPVPSRPVPSRPVPRDKRDGTGQEWIASMGRTS